MKTAAVSSSLPTYSFRHASSPLHVCVMGLCYLSICSKWWNWLTEPVVKVLRVETQLYKPTVSIHGWNLTGVWPMLCQVSGIFSFSTEQDLQKLLDIFADRVVCHLWVIVWYLFWILPEQVKSVHKGKKWDSELFFLNSRSSFQGRKVNRGVLGP